MAKFDYTKQVKELIIKYLDDVKFVDIFNDGDEADHICFSFSSYISLLASEIQFDEATQERVSDEEATERIKGNEELAEKAIEATKDIAWYEEDGLPLAQSDIDVWCREETIKEICKSVVADYIREHVKWFNIDTALNH